MVENRSMGRIVFVILNTLLMLGLCAAFVMPLWHIIMASVSDPRLLMASRGILWRPLGRITGKGYRLVLANRSIFTGYKNTLLYVTSTTIIAAVFTTIGGYVISRPKLRLKGPLTALILFTLMFSGGLIPSYMVNRALGLVGSRLSVIIPGSISAFYILMLKSAFEQLPPSFEESARLDGAPPLLILVRILVPLVKATIAVVVMFNIVQQWNSWFPASIYLPKQRDLWPLQLFMREILVQNDTGRILSGSDAINRADMTSNLVKYCVSVAGTLPILCIYPFVQKYFVAGATLGGVKE
jgi:putative aldouronate transport system permease protein